jgi:hypothetical protein
MNGRTIRKLLERGRAGQYYYLTVRLSKSQLGLVEPKRVTFEGMAETFEGEWESSGGTEHVRIGNPSCAVRPVFTIDAPWQMPIAVEPTAFGWTWWEGWHGVVQANGDVIRQPIDADIVRQYREHVRWFQALDSAHPVLRLFSEVCGIGHHRWETIGDALLIRHQMKVRYRNHKLWFCSALSRAMQSAKRAGIKSRVIGQVMA